MKNIIYKIMCGLLILITTITSCDSDKLVELNTDPNKIDNVIPAYSFAALLMNSNADFNYQSLGQGMQYFSTYREIGAPGDKLINFGGGGTNPYPGNLNRINRLLDKIPGPENVNRRAACIIMRVFALHNYTDIVGDIPYSEAQKGLNNLQPKYDKQKDIYAGLLNELDAALKSMDNTKLNVFGTNDIYFGGDVTRWKKYGYTLMLRMGMRMSEVDPATSKTWVQKAIAGGVMSEQTDIAYQKYANVSGQLNPRVVNLRDRDYSVQGGDNAEGGKYSATFIDFLKATKDPRLSVISVVWKPKPGGGYTQDTTFAHQRGMISGSVNGNPVDYDTYSEPSLLYIDFAAPILNVTPAEAYLLLAEASIRGWYDGMTAKNAYDMAVTRGMQQYALWPSTEFHSSIIPQSKIDAYLKTGNPFKANGTFEEKLEQIIRQKWVTLFGNDYEIWSEWRRTKYPVFNYKNWKDSNGNYVAYPGSVTGGHMWRRFALPSELATNKENYLAALASQGFQEGTLDLLQGRMWWDTPARGNGEKP